MVGAASKTAFQLRISLKDYTPVIWRRLLVPGGITLAKLHRMIQAAMGWEDYHLRCFDIDGVRYGISDPEYEMNDVDDETVRMADVIGPRSRFDYEYDFGDSWHHEVVVEAVTPIDLVLKFGVCLDGQRACPPEDVGGVHMFATVSRPSVILSTPSLRSISNGCRRTSILRPSTWQPPMLLCSGSVDQETFLARRDLVERSR